jgi:hypothetical protein
MDRGSSYVSNTIAVINQTVAVGDLLLVGVGWMRSVALAAPAVDIDGNALAMDVSNVGSTRIRGAIYSWLVTAPLVNKTVTATFVAAADRISILITKVTNLTGVLKEGKTAAVAPTENPDSGTTAAYAGEPSFHWGIVACQGNAFTDDLGAWQNGMTAGARQGPDITAVDLKEGFRIMPAGPVAAQAHIHSQTTRWTAPLIAYYE